MTSHGHWLCSKNIKARQSQDIRSLNLWSLKTLQPSNINRKVYTEGKYVIPLLCQTQFISSIVLLYCMIPFNDYHSHPVQIEP